MSGLYTDICCDIQIFVVLSEFDCCTWEQPQTAQELKLYMSLRPSLMVGRRMSIHHRGIIYTSMQVEELRYRSQVRYRRQHKQHQQHSQILRGQTHGQLHQRHRLTRSRPET